MALIAELDQLSSQLKAATDLTVVVMRSADPEFFLAQFDVAKILDRPTGCKLQCDSQLKPFHALCERFRTMNKIVIAQIEGRVADGRSELSASMNMRFGVQGKTKVNQMEVPLGIIPGGSGTQRLPHLMGRSRALELILSGDDMDAETAERWGYLNRIFQAERPWLEGLFEEAYLFEQLLRTDGARSNMQRFLEIGGQTREGELRMDELCAAQGDIEDTSS